MTTTKLHGIDTILLRVNVQHLEGASSLTHYGVNVGPVIMDAAAGKFVSRRQNLFDCSAHHGIETKRVSCDWLLGEDK